MKAQQNNKKYKLASRGYFIPGYQELLSVLVDSNF
jgi:hypothetical protein